MGLRPRRRLGLLGCGRHAPWDRASYGPVRRQTCDHAARCDRNFTPHGRSSKGSHCRSHKREITAIEGGHFAHLEPLRDSDEAGSQQVRRLGDDQLRHYERARVRLQEIEALGVVSVVRVHIGVQRPGVDDQGDPATSAARISSIRSEISERPLRPAAAASRRRRPPVRPRCALRSPAA